MSNKGELDKEKMFQKIMPSARRAEMAQTEVQAPPVEAEMAQAEVQAPPLEAEMAQIEVQAPPVEVLPQGVAEQEHNRGDVPLPVNVSELLTHQYYAFYREKIDGCPCERCQDDVMALTLNKAPVRYVASNHLDSVQPEVRVLTSEVVEALMNALFLVKNKPRHER